MEISIPDRYGHVTIKEGRVEVTDGNGGTLPNYGVVEDKGNGWFAWSTANGARGSANTQSAAEQAAGHAIIVHHEPWAELARDAKIVRVTATVTFEAYANTDHHIGHSTETRVAEQIADAIGYRAVGGSDLEPNDALIAMTGMPDFAVDVRDVDVAVVRRTVDLGHLVDQARSTSESW